MPGVAAATVAARSHSGQPGLPEVLTLGELRERGIISDAELKRLARLEGQALGAQSGTAHHSPLNEMSLEELQALRDQTTAAYLEEASALQERGIDPLAAELERTTQSSISKVKTTQDALKDVQISDELADTQVDLPEVAAHLNAQAALRTRLESVESQIHIRRLDPGALARLRGEVQDLANQAEAARREGPSAVTGFTPQRGTLPDQITGEQKLRAQMQQQHEPYAGSESLTRT